MEEKNYVRLISIFLLGLLSQISFAASIDNYFYFVDDPTISHRQATHRLVLPEHVPQTGSEDLIVIMNWVLFCKEYQSTSQCERLPGHKNVNKSIEKKIKWTLDILKSTGKISQVKAWHIIDEPYLPTHMVPKHELEYAMNLLRWKAQEPPYNMPDLPRWVNFSHDCFSCSSRQSNACASAGLGYCGIPGNAGWVGFDWYSADTQPKNCGNNSADCNLDQHMNNYVVPTMSALKNQAWSYQDLVLHPGTWSGNNDGTTAVGANEALARYVDLANADSRVIGVVPFTFVSYPNNEEIHWKGVSTMPNGIEAERFYQAIAQDKISGLGSNGWKPVFEYSDDKEYALSSGISAANAHYYSLGYKGTQELAYTVRRVAFYTKTSASGDYTKKVYRCIASRANNRHTVFFATSSNCYGDGTQAGVGYVSPVKTSSAPYKIINCRSSQSPYWDQGWMMVSSNTSENSACVSMFGHEYSYFGYLGYSKDM